MPRIKNSHHIKMGDNSDFSGDVTVVDVYDIASDIGKECERIIDQYGADAVTNLMPKVISALELLENLATRNERENVELYELQGKISQLENDKIEKAEYRDKFEKDLEAIEDQWRSETKELVSMVSQLQDENRRLVKAHVNPHYQTLSVETDMVSDGTMLQKLKDIIEKQRDEIRLKEKILQEKITDIENLRSQVDCLSSQSKDFRRKHKTLQNQLRTLCEERADFLVQLQDQHRDIVSLRQHLGMAQKENEDLAKVDFSVQSCKTEYDVDDPNRPRFTTQELKDILNERNKLKARISDLEDELESFRPKKSAGGFGKLLPLMNKIDILSSFKIDNQQTLTEEEAPVQGPLPYEPDDAPWKRNSESGVRKFFRKLFAEGDNGSSFPRHSFSTLSKMALSSTSESEPN